MKVEKNSSLAQMLLKLAAEHDPKLREAIRNGEVEGVNIIAVGGAPDGEVKELLESLAKDEDDCKNCENVMGVRKPKQLHPAMMLRMRTMTSASLTKFAVSPMTRTFLRASRPRPALFWRLLNSWTS